MELLQLKYFAESAETENFSVTAKNNFVPTSSVSISIKRLEKELRCQLFCRQSNKIKLNKNGEIFYNHIKSALNLIESGKEKISLNNEIESEEIKLLVKTERSLINDKILAFKKENQNITFKLTHSFSDIEYDNYDIIIDDLSNKYTYYRRKPIMQERIKIAASIHNPLANQKIYLRDLRCSDFITMSSGSSLYRIAKEVCNQEGFDPKIAIESDDPFYIRKYIKENYGIAFYPEKSWHDGLNDEICFLNVIDFNFSRITYAYLNENIKTPKSAKKLFEYLDSNL